MDKHAHIPSSHLFTVQVWQEDLGDGQSEWRGKVRHVQSGEASYFRDWDMLVLLFLKMLQEDAFPTVVDE